MQINSDEKLEGSSLDHDGHGHQTTKANMDVGVDTENNVTSTERREDFSFEWMVLSADTNPEDREIQ